MASKSGILRVGDKILKINGQDLDALSHGQVAQMFSKKKIKITVKHWNNADDSDSSDESGKTGYVRVAMSQCKSKNPFLIFFFATIFARNIERTLAKQRSGKGNLVQFEIELKSLKGG